MLYIKTMANIYFSGLSNLLITSLFITWEKLLIRLASDSKSFSPLLNFNANQLEN